MQLNKAHLRINKRGGSFSCRIQSLQVRVVKHVPCIKLNPEEQWAGILQHQGTSVGQSHWLFGANFLKKVKRKIQLCHWRMWESPLCQSYSDAWANMFVIQGQYFYFCVKKKKACSSLENQSPLKMECCQRRFKNLGVVRGIERFIWLRSASSAFRELLWQRLEGNRCWFTGEK